jgi:hypothetical protein
MQGDRGQVGETEGPVGEQTDHEPAARPSSPKLVAVSRRAAACSCFDIPEPGVQQLPGVLDSLEFTPARGPLPVKPCDQALHDEQIRTGCHHRQCALQVADRTEHRLGVPRQCLAEATADPAHGAGLRLRLP